MFYFSCSFISKYNLSAIWRIARVALWLVSPGVVEVHVSVDGDPRSDLAVRFEIHRSEQAYFRHPANQPQIAASFPRPVLPLDLRPCLPLSLHLRE